MQNLKDIIGNDGKDKGEKLPKKKLDEIAGEVIVITDMTILPSNYENEEYAIITAYFYDDKDKKQFVFFSCNSMLNQIVEKHIDEIVEKAKPQGICTLVVKRKSKKGYEYFVFDLD